mmetsp:Transcript_50413/g.107951  ORF Transcript_50413/g.107951 Transcript_50413/m.107951 type:complete len:81 (-) Transcript_50413:84-326(-)
MTSDLRARKNSRQCGRSTSCAWKESCEPLWLNAKLHVPHFGERWKQLASCGRHWVGLDAKLTLHVRIGEFGQQYPGGKLG